MNDFNGLVAVITGGASGIGAATATHLLGRGATVAVLDRAYSAVTRTAVLEVPCDVADPDSTRTAVDTVASALGCIDILVNNAGIGATGDVTQNEDDEWHRVLSVNVVGIARVTRAALPYLRRSSNAAIVNTCSVVADVGVPQRALYSASKGAVRSLTLAMAADFVTQGIRVHAVSPGFVHTPAHRARLSVPGVLEEYVANTALGRRAHPRTSPTPWLFCARRRLRGSPVKCSTSTAART